jgi:hypothetical protein
MGRFLEGFLFHHFPLIAVGGNTIFNYYGNQSGVRCQSITAIVGVAINSKLRHFPSPGSASQSNRRSGRRDMHIAGGEGYRPLVMGRHSVHVFRSYCQLFFHGILFPAAPGSLTAFFPGSNSATCFSSAVTRTVRASFAVFNSRTAASRGVIRRE